MLGIDVVCNTVAFFSLLVPNGNVLQNELEKN